MKEVAKAVGVKMRSCACGEARGGVVVVVREC